MELEFDKEIDVLLRKARADSAASADAAVSPHLDADGISAFAENAMPERAKQLYMAHMAECGRCRKILSNTIMLNSGAESTAASAIISSAAVEQSMPWYRKLFLFPNLAYVMGSLILVFSGFLGYLVLQNTTGSLSSEVSHLDDSLPAASGPNFDENEGYANSNATMKAANTAMNTASNAVNTTSSAANTAYPPAPVIAANGARAGTSASPEREILTDAAAAPLPREQPRGEKDHDALATSEDKADVTMQDSQKKGVDLKMRDVSPPAGGPSKSAKEPTRNERNDSRSRSLSEGRTMSSTEESSRRRLVAGKTFELKQGVWYDTAYRGQRTKNVSRGTGEYLKLDSGLRIIAESLDGTVVVVWRAKAYRIQ